MWRFNQLELVFDPRPPRAGRDIQLERDAAALLRQFGFDAEIIVEWNTRMSSTAGRADFRRKRISLNPRLHAFGEAEIDRTVRHELAHLLAQLRAGRRRIAPHGEQWRRACADLGIADEVRCHTLPLPMTRRARRFLYRCGNCGRDFPRTRALRRPHACLACCRAHSRGAYDGRFRLRLVNA